MTAVWKARPESPVYDEMRTRLVDAAEEIMHEEGAAALRLDAVAASADCHRSSVYRYFENKEELITAVIVRSSLELGNAVIASLGNEDDPKVLLVEGIVRSLGALMHDPTHQSLMQPFHSVAMNRVAGRVVSEALQPLLRPLLEVSDERGGLRDDVSADDAMRWLVVVVVGLVERPNILDSEDDLRDLLRRMLVPAILRVD